MTKKLRIVATILIIIGLSIISGTTIYLLKHQNIQKKTKYSYDDVLKDMDLGEFSLINKKDINNCKNDNCDILRTNIPTLKINTSNETLEKIITEENEINESYYQEYINSTMDDSSCEQYKDKYYHSIYPTIDVNVYSNDNLSTFSIKRSKYNLCTKENEINIIKSIIYDKKANKVLTKEDILKQNNLTYDDNIIKTITDTLANVSKINNTDLSLDNCLYKDNQIIYELYYTSDGNLWVEFMLKDLNDNINTLSEILLAKK